MHYAILLRRVPVIVTVKKNLDDRPRLGGKTPPSPGRRVPVDSPEDRRFSNRSKSHRRCRHAMETSHGRSDGRSDAGYGNRVRLGTVGKAPHCGSRTPDFAVFLVRDFAKDYRRDANAGRRPPLAVSCRRAGTGYGTQATASRYLEEKFFLLEPTSTTGRGSAARPRPRPGDACRSIAPRTDVSQIGPNRIAVAGTPWKLRTDVPTDVPTPVMEEKNFLLEPTSTTGRGSAARPRPRPGDACRSIAPRTDVSQIGRNRIAVAGTPWKLRTDVPTDVPTPAMAAGSDSERWGKLLTVGVALRTLPFFWYGISQKNRGKRRQETAACCLVLVPAPAIDAGDRVSYRKKSPRRPRRRPRLGGKTPPSPGRRVPVDTRTDVSDAGRCRTPWSDVPTDVPTTVMEENIFLLEPGPAEARKKSTRAGR